MLNSDALASQNFFVSGNSLFSPSLWLLPVPTNPAARRPD
jgi:hypothetical protein